MPNALNTAAVRGMSTCRAPAFLAAPHTVIGPPPPNAARTVSSSTVVASSRARAIAATCASSMLPQRLVEGDPQRSGDLGLDHLRAAVRVQHHGATQVGRRVEQTGQQQDIGEGGFVAAQPEAGRTRCGAHTFRADLDLAVDDAEDRAAADAVAGDGGELQGARRVVDHAAPVDTDSTVGDDPDVGGGAPDVHHDQVAQAVMAGQRPGALQAAARARAVGLERGGLRDPGRPAVVAEDPQRLAGPGRRGAAGRR